MYANQLIRHICSHGNVNLLLSIRQIRLKLTRPRDLFKRLNVYHIVQCVAKLIIRECKRLWFHQIFSDIKVKLYSLHIPGVTKLPEQKKWQISLWISNRKGLYHFFEFEKINEILIIFCQPMSAPGARSKKVWLDFSVPTGTLRLSTRRVFESPDIYFSNPKIVACTSFNLTYLILIGNSENRRFRMRLK